MKKMAKRSKTTPARTKRKKKAPVEPDVVKIRLPMVEQPLLERGVVRLPITDWLPKNSRTYAALKHGVNSEDAQNALAVLTAEATRLPSHLVNPLAAQLYRIAMTGR